MLPGLIFIYMMIRLIIPLPVSGKTKLLTAILLLLVSQQHILIRYAFGGMAAPELPVPVLLVSGWSFVSLVFLLFLLLILDICLLLRWLGRLLLQRLSRSAKKQAGPPFSHGRRQALLTALAIIPAAYGLRQGVAAPKAHTVETRLPRLPQELDGLTLVQISDLHISPLFQEERTRAVVDTVNALEPDLILFTGDTVDGSPERRAGAIAPLKDLRARYGVFGCMGNHEYYGGHAAWTRVFPELGITMLQNSHVVLRIRGRKVVVAGLADSAAERFSLTGPDVVSALAKAPEDAIRILLDHHPGNAPENARAGVDLQLSGHTHGGHIPGLSRLVAGFNQGFVYGWYQVDNMRLYVSSGAGLWNGFPARLGVPSEVAHIVLRSAS
jgi:predicted MPP superfamily phosphohydrolase